MAALIHTAPHPLSGQMCTLEFPPNSKFKNIGLVERSPETVTVRGLNGADYTVEDWADRVGIVWQNSTEKWSTIYVMRLMYLRLPFNNEVVAGWVGMERYLAHVCELRYDGDLLGDLDVTSF